MSENAVCDVGNGDEQDDFAREKPDEHSERGEGDEGDAGAARCLSD